MTVSIMTRIPVVGALCYVEHVRSLPAAFTATLQAEPENRYFRHAIKVMVDGRKSGYVAPEIAAGVFEAVLSSPSPLSCGGRKASRSDHETSGVELLLDFSALQLPSAP